MEGGSALLERSPEHENGGMLFCSANSKGSFISVVQSVISDCRKKERAICTCTELA